jgi:hypothetical protein
MSEMSAFDDHFAAACLTLVWGYRNQTKINIKLLDQNFKTKLSIGTLGTGHFIAPRAVEFIDVLDPGDSDPVILVVLTTGIEYRIDPKARTITQSPS